MRYKHITFALLSLFLLCLDSQSAQKGLESLLSQIKLPPGFKISVYAENLPGARSMTLGAEGTLFVGTRQEGKVYAVLDRNKDNVADKVFVIAKGLNMPNGVAFLNGALYVAEISRVLRYDNIEKRLENPPSPVVVNDSFPGDYMHGWKFIRFGPDGLLYVPIGMPCNVCERKDKRYGTIMRINRMAQLWRFMLLVFATQLALTGIHSLRNCGSLITVGTGWGMISRRIS